MSNPRRSGRHTFTATRLIDKITIAEPGLPSQTKEAVVECANELLKALAAARCTGDVETFRVRREEAGEPDPVNEPGIYKIRVIASIEGQPAAEPA